MALRPQPDDARVDAMQLGSRQRVQLLFFARCCYRAGFAMLPTASPALLLRLVGGDAARAQRIFAFVSTANAAISYFMQPLLGQLGDSYGRKPVLLVPMLVACVCRLWVAMRPSVGSYVADGRQQEPW